MRERVNVCRGKAPIETTDSAFPKIWQTTSEGRCNFTSEKKYSFGIIAMDEYKALSMGYIAQVEKNKTKKIIKELNL